MMWKRFGSGLLLGGKVAGLSVVTMVTMATMPMMPMSAAQPKAAAVAKGKAVADKAAVQLQPVGTGVWIDWEHGVLEAAGSCAADLFSASVDVARVKAERLARLRAEDRLRKALVAIGHAEKDRARLAAFGGVEVLARLDVTQARVASIDYASSGSVSLRLSLPLRPAAADSAIAPAHNVDLGASPAPADGGADGRTSRVGG